MKKLAWILPILLLLLTLSCASTATKRLDTQVLDRKIVYQQWYQLYCSAYSLGAEADDETICSDLQLDIYRMLANHPNPDYRASAVFISCFCKVSCKAGCEKLPILDYSIFKKQIQEFFESEDE